MCSYMMNNFNYFHKNLMIALSLFFTGIEKYANQIVHCNKKKLCIVCKGMMLNVKFKDKMERLCLVLHQKS